MQKYYIYCRYEFMSSNGKIFSNWFRTGKSHETEESAKNEMNSIKETSKEIDKHTKMKHEYEIRCLDETLIPQIQMRRPKGRPKKFTTDELDKYVKTLNKCNQVKVDDNVKEFLYNDEDAKKYIEEHIKEKNVWCRYWYDNNNDLYIILKDNSETILH